MIKTLRESKAKLSELVEMAGRGEDVLITVRGKVKARLTRVPEPEGASDRAAWLRELQKLHKSCSSKKGPTVDAILTDLREDRD